MIKKVLVVDSGNGTLVSSVEIANTLEAVLGTKVEHKKLEEIIEENNSIHFTIRKTDIPEVATYDLTKPHHPFQKFIDSKKKKKR